MAKTCTLKNATTMFWVWVSSLLIIVAMGGYAWTVQFTRGLAVTGMGNTVIWALYIANYTFFIGLGGAGILISSAIYIFDVKRFEPLAKIALLVSMICTLLAATSILPDLGRPDRIAHVFLYGMLQSPFIWDLTTILSYLIVCTVYLWFSTIRPSHKAVKVIAPIAVVLSVADQSVAGWIFGLVKSRPFWHSPLVAPIFASLALTSGLSLLILVSVLSSRFLRANIDQQIVSDVAKIVAIVIPIDLFLLFNEFLTAAYANVPERVSAWSFVTTGSYGPLFWGTIVCGSLIPFFVLASPRTRVTTVGLTIASFLVVVGAFARRFLMIVPGLLNELPYLDERYIGAYSPTWVELTIVAGFLALAALLYTAGVKILRIFQWERT